MRKEYRLKDIRSVRSHDLTVILRLADTGHVFVWHEATFVTAETVRVRTACSTEKIRVYVPLAFSEVPREVMFEIMQCAIKRARSVDSPMFGPKAVAYLKSPAFARTMRLRLSTNARFSVSKRYSVVHLEGIMREAVRYLSDHVGILARARVRWRSSHLDLCEAPLISSEYTIGLLVVDPYLDSGYVSRDVFVYTVFRELAAFCAYSLSECAVDPAKFAELLRRYPGGTSIERACLMVGWTYTVPRMDL